MMFGDMLKSDLSQEKKKILLGKVIPSTDAGLSSYTIS
jgi:hypothetical protein